MRCYRRWRYLYMRKYLSYLLECLRFVSVMYRSVRGGFTLSVRCSPAQSRRKKKSGTQGYLIV